MFSLIVFGNDTQKNGSYELLFDTYVNNRNLHVNGVEICSILFYSQCNSPYKFQDKRTCFLHSYFLVLLHFSDTKRQDYLILVSVMMFYISFSRQWLKSEDIQRISLLFYNKTLEKEVSYFHCKFTTDSFFA